MITRIVRWLSVPALLAGSAFSSFAGPYEYVLDNAMCLGAMIAVLFAVRSRQVAWAGGLLSVAVAYSPLQLVVKIFALLGLACIGMLWTVRTVWRLQAEPARFQP